MQRIDPSGSRSIAADLFASISFGYVADAILEGHMGSVLVDRLDRPSFAALEGRNDVSGILVLGGDPHVDAARRFVETIPANSEVLFASEPLLALAKEEIGDRAIERERCLLSSDTIDSDFIERLAANGPAGFERVPIDAELAQMLRADTNWSDKGHGINFRSPRTSRTVDTASAYSRAARSSPLNRRS